MALIRDLNVKIRLNVLSSLLRDKGDADMRPGRHGTQRKEIIDIAEVDIRSEELEERLTNAQLVLQYGYDVDTTKPPPQVVTDDATAIGETSVILNGHVKSGSAAIAATCGFEYGTSPEFELDTVADQSPVMSADNTAISATLAGLTAGTKYYYRAVATDVNYVTGKYGVVKSFITLSET